MNLKKINKVLLYTLLVFSIFTFSGYPKSFSKYIKEDDNALIYHVSIEALNKGDNDSLALTNSSTYKEANFSFNFSQSELFNNTIDKSQIYNISVNNSCTITNIDTNAKVVINGSTATLTYSKKGTDNIIVDYTCLVDDIKTTIDEVIYIESSIDVKEKFMPENKSYNYTNGSLIISLDDYLERYPLPDGVISADKKTFTLPKVVNNKYEKVNAWLNEYIKTYGSDYSVTTLAYFKTLYPNEDAIFLDKGLKGIVITETIDNYIYTIDDNFIGYARTYENREIIPNYLYFSTTDVTLTSEAFEYYLNTYTYPGETEKINRIINYVNLNGGISSIMVPDALGNYKTIPGLYYSDNQVLVENNIMDYIEIFETKIIKITITDMFSMYSVLVNTLQSVYDFISIDTYNKIIADGNVINSVTMNNTDSYSEIVPFNDYYVFDNVLLHISSDGLINKVEAFELIDDEEIKISFLKTEESEIVSTLELIDTYLGTTLKEQFNSYIDITTVSGTYGIFASEITDAEIILTFTIDVV